MSLCRSCNRYMSSSRFSPSASDVAIGRCLDCTDRDNAARHRNDFSRFKIILRRLQADEVRLSGEAQMPFLLQVIRWAISPSWTVPFNEEMLMRVSWQVEDVRYLVEVVWASRSVLHGSGDLYDLVLVRWDRWKDWSPWNCILLSKNEAKAHMELEDINKVRTHANTPPETHRPLDHDSVGSSSLPNLVQFTNVRFSLLEHLRFPPWCPDPHLYQ